MTLRDYTANVISASKVVPDGAFQDSAASGVWDINEALDLIKGSNWPTTGNFNPAAFVDALFQTHLYTGTSDTGSEDQTIVNGINLSGKGGLVWAKVRSANRYAHSLIDTERGRASVLYSNSTSAAGTSASNRDLTSFNNNGFSLTKESASNARK